MGDIKPKVKLPAAPTAETHWLKIYVIAIRMSMPRTKLSKGATTQPATMVRNGLSETNLFL